MNEAAQLGFIQKPYQLSELRELLQQTLKAA